MTRGGNVDQAVAYVLAQFAERHSMMRDEPAKMQGVVALLEDYRQILFDNFSTALGRDKWSTASPGLDKEVIQPG